MTFESADTSPPDNHHEKHRKNREWRSFIPRGSEVKTVLRIVKTLNEPPPEGHKTLYEPQKQVVADIAAAMLRNPGLNGYIDLPTGAGKTVIAIALLLAIKRDGVIAVPTLDIKSQFINSLESMGARQVMSNEPGITLEGMSTPLTSTPLPPGLHSRTLSASDILMMPNGTHVVVTTHNSLRSGPLAQELQALDQTSPRILIVDEGHEVLGTQTREALKHYLQSDQWTTLAMSATPEYSEESVGIANHSLEEHIGPCLHRITIQEAINARLIAPFRMSQMEVGMSPDTPVFGTRSRAIPRAEIARMNTEHLKAATVALLRDQLLEGKKVVIQCNSIQLAQEIKELINIEIPTRSAYHINGRMKSVDRQRECDQFNNSDDGVIIGAELVGEGLDLTGLDAAIIVGNTESKVRMMQAFGRALRPIPGRAADITKELIHITNPQNKDAALRYMAALRQSGHIPGRTKDDFSGAEVVSFTKPNITSITYQVGGSQQYSSLLSKGEVTPNAQTQARDVPEGYISWLSLLGTNGRVRSYQETQLTILAIAIHEHPDLVDAVMIAKGRTQQRGDPEWGLWLSPTIAHEYSELQTRMQAIGVSNEYVTAVQIANHLGFDRRLIVQFIDDNRDNTNIPELQHARLGLVPKTTEGRLSHFGFVTEMYPVTILVNPLLPHKINREQLADPDWYSIRRVENGECDEIRPDLFTRIAFNRFLNVYLSAHPDAQSLVRYSSVIGSRDPLDRHFHRDLIRAYRQYVEAEHTMRERYTSIRKLKQDTGILEREIYEYIKSLPALDTDDTAYPYIRRFEPIGHRQYGDHIRTDILPDLAQWIVARREKVRSKENLFNILQILAKERTNREVDDNKLREIMNFHEDPDRKRQRYTERDRLIRRMRADGREGEVRTGICDLVDVILDDYQRAIEASFEVPDYTPLE